MPHAMVGYAIFLFLFFLFTHVAAPECVVGVSGDNLSDAIDTGDWFIGGIAAVCCGVELTGSSLGVP